PVFKEMAAEGNGDMHPVSVEYLFEGDKAIFYFEAEERVDFRELVRKLAAHFRVRIDMRQIGVRDEARMVGGLGHCGQELCCKRLGGEFCPVSIRMAKEQDLSLNPQKISGVCGRLMCCLRYEFDAYKDFKSRAPKQNATVETPDGPAKVVDLDVPREIVSLKWARSRECRWPLRPARGCYAANAVGRRPGRGDERSRAHRRQALIFSTSQFTGADKLAEGAKVRHTGGSRKGSGRRGARAAATRAAGAAARARRGRRRRLRHRPPARKRRRSGCRRPTTSAVWSACPLREEGARGEGRIAEAVSARDGLAAQGRRAPQDGGRSQAARQSGRPGKAQRAKGSQNRSLRRGSKPRAPRRGQAEILGAAGRRGGASRSDRLRRTRALQASAPAPLRKPKADGGSGGLRPAERNGGNGTEAGAHS
ncbi:MAG: regulatory iron-sulfur-containing complex subunit RicT, partial [Eggerthella lenta]